MRQFKSRCGSASDARFHNASHAAVHYLVERLEQRVCLSSAIAAFGTQQTFATGVTPNSVAVADVNSDGKPDLLIANDSPAGTVSVLLGNGNGTFQSQQTFAVGSAPYSIAAADVNGDGKVDLVVANSGSNTVSVLLGNGDGTFQAQQTFATGAAPVSVVVSDINGDGKLDLEVANQGANTVSVLLGIGNGTFQSQQTFAVGATPYSVAASDVNGDGKPDLVVANAGSNSVSVLLGNGDGTFQAQQTFATGSYPVSVAVSDVNGDGKPDLVTANYSSGSVSVLPGNGNGTFQTQQTFAAGSGPASVTLADINRDGKPDVVVANAGSNNVGVLLGSGTGTFQTQKTFGTGTSPAAVAVSDLNGDGRPDIAVANSTSNTVGVLLGDIQPTVLSINRTSSVGPIISNHTTVIFTVTFNEPVTGVDVTDFALALSGVTTSTPVIVDPVSTSVYTVTVNGISGAGTLGLNLVDNGSIQDLSGNLLQPGGTAAFGAQQTFLSGTRPDSVAVADVNGDGKLDMVVANLGSVQDENDGIGIVSVLLGNGDGTFQAAQTFAAATAPFFVTVSDLNGDGRPDLVVADAGIPFVSVLLGNGNGTFQAQQFFAAGGHPKSVAVADVNGDGKPDVVVNSGTYTASVLLGNGDGTFQPQLTFATHPIPESVAVADVNRDGKPDMLVANFNNGTVSVLLGNGNGNFQAQQTFAVGVQPDFVVVSDVNGDGNPDLVVANYASSNVSVLLGNGNGTFQSQQVLATGKYARSVAVSDVNGDGRPDVVVTNSINGTLSVLLGNGTGTFQAQQTFATGNRPASVAVADVNGDGRPDLIAAEEYSGTGGTSGVGVLLGTTNGNVVGQTYTIVPSLDTVIGTAGGDLISLTEDPDHIHIDWTLRNTTAQMLINDLDGLTVNGNGNAIGGNDAIALNYANGDPLPNKLNLNGIFSINLPTTGNPLANTTIDLEKSTLIIPYQTFSGTDPIATIVSYLKTGYDNGLWTGTSENGSILSSSAAADANRTSAIAYADLPLGDQQFNIKLKYTLYGDTGLTGTVGFTDFMRMTQHFTQSSGAAWAQGDFNYDGAVNAADFALLQPNYGQTLPTQSFVVASVTPPTPGRPPRSVSLPPPASALVDSTSTPTAAALSDVSTPKHAKIKRRHGRHG